MSGEVQKHYKVPTLEWIKKHAMENIGPRIHNQGKWLPASRPDRCTNRKRDAGTGEQGTGWARTRQRNKSRSLFGIERQFLCRPSHSLVTIMISYIKYKEFNEKSTATPQTK